MKAGWIAIAIPLAAVIATPARAVPCDGGTLDISATSDTPLNGLAYNVGQRADFAAQTSGIAPVSFAWSIPGPYIKDYQDDLGTIAGAATPIPWSTIPITASDLSLPTVSLYWQPSSAQTHPNAGPPENRTVVLTATLPNATTCQASLNVTVERNLTDPDRQPEDFYTSNHRASTSTNPQNGRVLDEHIYWHEFVQGGPTGSWLQFLAWHSYFLRRFDEWRQAFGYAPVAPWYPGRPLPTGPEFDHPPSLRLVYDPDANRLPRIYTLAGEPPPSSSPARLGDFTSVDSLTGMFENTFHGWVHCRIGVAPPFDPNNPNDPEKDFFTTSGPWFGSMCMASSPKDPMFWRWHGFIDLLYRNYCALRAISCHSPPDPPSDPWMGDNAADVAAGGIPPSPSPRWMSPDIWNRRQEVTTDACIPRTSPPDLNTVGGVTRDCGSEADHENPVAGDTNYLYATLRNTGPNPQRNVYAEVAIYIANASTGLSWPADFTMLPESRQFITLNLEPGQVTQIGPLPWTPPAPSPSDHWCIYIRVLSVQEAPLSEGSSVDANVMNSNSIAWRNLKIVNPGERAMSRFIVRNVRDSDETLGLEILVAPELLRQGRVVLTLDPRLRRALGDQPGLRGVEPLQGGEFAVGQPRAMLHGLRLPPRGEGVAEIRLEGLAREGIAGDVVVSQRSSAGLDGGVTLRVVPAQRERR